MVKTSNVNEVYAPITIGNYTSAIGVRLPSDRKWFNPTTKTLDPVPNFAMIKSGTPTNTPSGIFNMWSDSGKRNPTQTTTIVPVPLNGTPRVSNLTRVKVPTEANPNSLKVSTLSGTRKVQVYNTADNTILKTIDVNPGSDYTINLPVPLYNHIYYGVRYLDGNGVNQSLGLEYLFKGVQLAAPDEMIS